VTQPEVLREVKIATPPSWLIRVQNPLDPFLKGCGWPKFKALLPVHGDQIMDGLKFCNPGLMDLEALVALARPVSMHISQLTGAEIEILAGDIANDPRAFWLSRPAALPRLTHERAIRLAILWPETPDRWRVDITDAVWDHLEQNGISRDDVDLHLSDGAFQTVSGAGRDSEQTSIFGTPYQGPDGPVLVPDTLRFFQPTLTASCTPTACAALEGVDLSPPLARMRDPATLSADLKDAPWFSPTQRPTLTPEAIAQDGLQIGPVQERRHLTRHVTLK